MGVGSAASRMCHDEGFPDGKVRRSAMTKFPNASRRRAQARKTLVLETMKGDSHVPQSVDRKRELETDSFPSPERARAGGNDFVDNRDVLRGKTKRGIPANYAGEIPELCNARTRSGRPCRALGIGSSGRCKWHGGKSTGPRTVEGKARSAMNLSKALKQLAKLRRQAVLVIERGRLATRASDESTNADGGIARSPCP